MNKPNTKIIKLFNPLRLKDEKKKSTLVAEEIVKSINAKKLRPGDKLPSEREIAEHMQISRTVVREALIALRIVGIISIHIGDGSYVNKKIKGDSRLSKAFALLEKNESPLEIWEARKSLEAMIAELALEKVTEGDINKLEKIFKNMSNSVESIDYENYLKLNKQFHLTLLSTVKNSILYRISSTLLEMTDQLLTKEPTQRYLLNYLPRSLAKHKSILDAFKKYDLHELRASIDNHFIELERFYMEEYE